jgi:pSer/pThr/pTyr-binding forkhead associated (FHA) protein
MAKLYLKFEANILKEVNIGQKDVVTIGRLPDNGLQIDNLAVSGHHARVFWDVDHFAIEDNQSLNGTYVNNQRITKHALKDNDSVLIGKHNIVFKDEWHEDTPSTAPASKAKAMPALPKMESTVVLDTKKAKEMLAAARAAANSASVR